jgi:pimeloyl-ACP methyl ester carboxylesterase
MKERTGSGIAWKVALGTGAGLLAAGMAGKIARGMSPNGLDSHIDTPSRDYDAALTRLAQLEALDDGTINPLCRLQLMTHGHKVENVVVLIHGLTNCPQQFVEFAPLFYRAGYNVLIPRMPRNGLADRMTNELKYLTAEELRDFGNTLVDIADGLGEHITFVGISAGGAIAAWVAQHRSEVDKAVLIAPSLGIGPLGIGLSTIAMSIILTLPNISTQYVAPFQDGPQHSYFGYSSYALAQVMRLGLSIYHSARKKKLGAQCVMLITNASDPAVNDKITWRLITKWRAKGLERLDVYRFGAESHLIHDIIDPQQVQQQIAMVYPILFDLIIRQPVPPVHARSGAVVHLESVES